ncbi:MAG: ABC transporter permease, partial [Pseudomonadota bacterium]
MSALWDGLAAPVQDALWLLILLTPAGAIGGWVLRHGQPWPLVRAMLWRFRGANALFVLLIALSMGCGIALLAQERGLRTGTAAAAGKFDLIVAAPGNETTALLATVYLRPGAMGLVSGADYTEIAAMPGVTFAAPMVFGDSVDGAPLVGTIADFVAHLSDGEMSGRLFERLEEAVAGAYAPVGLGQSFTPVHGAGGAAFSALDQAAHEGWVFE